MICLPKDSSTQPEEHFLKDHTGRKHSGILDSELSLVRGTNENNFGLYLEGVLLVYSLKVTDRWFPFSILTARYSLNITE